MKRILILIFIIINFCFKPIAQNIWVSGYYAGWDKNLMPPDSINFNAITHLIHFSLMPNAGALENYFGLTASHINATVTAAHNAGKKVLICIGGAGSESGFLTSTANKYLNIFTSNILNILTTYNYDGIDIDWEPIAIADSTQIYTFINILKIKMDSINPALELTTPTYFDYWNPSLLNIYGKIQNKINQINLMTYTMSGANQGWITWHSSPLYNGSKSFPDYQQEPLPSADYWAQNFIKAGIAPGKLGIGLGFDCDIWKGGSNTSTGGVTKPLQSWINAPTVSYDNYYAAIMSNYYNSNRYHYDSIAEAPYLSINTSVDSTDMFISYTDERAITAKLNYIKQQKLGGCIIWQLAQDYFSKNNQPLKKAIANELNPTGIIKNPQTDLVNNKISVSCYPNPTEQQLTVQVNLNKATILCISLYNSIGENIASYSEKYINKNIIHTFNFNYPAGLYSVKIQTDENQIISKVLKL